MAAANPMTVGSEICKALGLDRVISLDIRIRMDEFVSVTAEMVADEQQGEELATVLKRYELREMAEPHSELATETVTHDIHGNTIANSRGEPIPVDVLSWRYCGLSDDNGNPIHPEDAAKLSGDEIRRLEVAARKRKLSTPSIAEPQPVKFREFL